MSEEQIMADIEEGLRQSEAGEVFDLGSFEEYADAEADDLHALADLIEHVQTTWEADRDQYIEPLAEFTARGILAAGYRLTGAPESIVTRDPDPQWDRFYGDGTRIMRPATTRKPQGEPSIAQVRADAQEYAANRFRGVIYLSEYNAAVSAFVEGVDWASVASGGVVGVDEWPPSIWKR